MVNSQSHFITLHDISCCVDDSFLSDPGKPGVRSLGPLVCPSVRLSVTETPCVDLTDVTLADEDTKSILIDNEKKFSTEKK